MTHDAHDIDDILAEIVTLPSLPGTITRVREMLDDPDCSLHQVGEVISTDPGIALKTLRLVNSAQYGTRNPVSSVEQAVALLGAKVVRNLVLSAAIFDQLRGGTDQFLRHSIACGLAMEMLAGASPGVALDPDEAFVYGVLHDIGVVVFQEFMPDRHLAATTLAERKGIPLFQAEREVIGVDHAALGARLARHWRLPQELVDAVAGHHDLERASAPNRELAALLGLADFIVNVSGITSGLCVPPPLAAGAEETIRIPRPEVPAVIDSFFMALPNVDELVAAALC